MLFHIRCFERTHCCAEISELGVFFWSFVSESICLKVLKMYFGSLWEWLFLYMYWLLNVFIHTVNKCYVEMVYVYIGIWDLWHLRCIRDYILHCNQNETLRWSNLSSLTLMMLLFYGWTYLSFSCREWTVQSGGCQWLYNTDCWNQIWSTFCQFWWRLPAVRF